MAQESEELEVKAALPEAGVPEAAAEVVEKAPEVVEESPDAVEEAPEVLREVPADVDMVFDKMDHEVDREAGGLTVGDGFRFGCGFVLAMAIGTLAFLIVLTAFLAVGAVMGFKLPI